AAAVAEQHQRAGGPVVRPVNVAGAGLGPDDQQHGDYGGDEACLQTTHERGSFPNPWYGPHDWHWVGRIRPSLSGLFIPWSPIWCNSAWSLLGEYGRQENDVRYGNFP